MNLIVLHAKPHLVNVTLCRVTNSNRILLLSDIFRLEAIGFGPYPISHYPIYIYIMILCGHLHTLYGCRRLDGLTQSYKLTTLPSKCKHCVPSIKESFSQIGKLIRLIHKLKPKPNMCDVCTVH